MSCCPCDPSDSDGLQCPGDDGRPLCVPREERAPAPSSLFEFSWARFLMSEEGREWWDAGIAYRAPAARCDVPGAVGLLNTDERALRRAEELARDARRLLEHLRASISDVPASERLSGALERLRARVRDCDGEQA